MLGSINIPRLVLLGHSISASKPDPWNNFELKNAYLGLVNLCIVQANWILVNILSQTFFVRLACIKQTAYKTLGNLLTLSKDELKNRSKMGQ